MFQILNDPLVFLVFQHLGFPERFVLALPGLNFFGQFLPFIFQRLRHPLFIFLQRFNLNLISVHLLAHLLAVSQLIALLFHDLPHSLLILFLLFRNHEPVLGAFTQSKLELLLKESLFSQVLVIFDLHLFEADLELPLHVRHLELIVA